MREVSAETVAAWLRDGQEIAFLDVREHGQYGESHPLRVVWLPYSLLEARAPALLPRRGVRCVLLDAGDGVAARAAARLEGLGFSAVHVLAGGHPAWEAAGLECFKGVNVPSKAFGEMVEHTLDTPRIEPAELAAMVARGDDLVIVDGRTPAEFARMSIPGARCVPNGELVWRIHAIAPDPATTVVVNCAGRTRSIIGAQTLRNAGVPNRVVALKGGTKTWRFAGHPLDSGRATPLPEVGGEARERALARAAGLRERCSIPLLDGGTLATWLADDARTTYLFDVRGEEEYAAGHHPRARHAPGGQLVQATDQWVAVWNARIVLADEGAGVRATTAAHWLAQMGFRTAVLSGGEEAAGATGPERLDAPMPDGARHVPPADAKAMQASGAAILIDVDESAHYLARRLPGARWACRPRLVPLVAALPKDVMPILYSEHETRARLAAVDALEAAGGRAVGVLAGGREAWCAAGLATEAGALDDAERIDFLFWVHDRDQGNDDAAREYLRWEENLPAQLARSGEPPYPLLT